MVKTLHLPLHKELKVILDQQAQPVLKVIPELLALKVPLVHKVLLVLLVQLVKMVVTRL